jgi:hypothetical protein
MVGFSVARGQRPKPSAGSRQPVPLTHLAVCWAPETDAHEAPPMSEPAPRGGSSSRRTRATAFGSVNQRWFSAARHIQRAGRPPAASAAASVGSNARQLRLAGLSTSISRYDTLSVAQMGFCRRCVLAVCRFQSWVMQ